MQIEPLSPEMGIIVSANPGEAEATPETKEIISLVSSHGVAVFRGFPLALSDFHELAEHISPGPHRGVGDTTNGLQFHSEGFFLPIRIDLLWFYCISPPDSGGATTLCDGIQVADALSSAAHRFFDENPLTYEIRLSRQWWTQTYGDISAEQAAQRVLSEMGPVADGYGDGCQFSCRPMSQDEILAVFGRKAIVSTRWGDCKAFANTLLHALDPWASSQNEGYVLVTEIPREILSEVEEVTERLTQELHWKSSNFAVVDNSRLLHGRRAYEGPRNIQAINGELPD